MLAIIGGLGAALCWATTTLVSARSARRIGVYATLAWAMLLGLVLTIPLLLLTEPVELTRDQILLLGVSGSANVLGLLFTYAALKAGKVAVVGPIISTEGALAAVIAVVAGESLGLPTAGVLTALVVGVVLASIDRETVETVEAGAPRLTARAILLALGAAAAFGLNLYTVGRIGTELPVAWAILPARLVGTVVVAIPLLLTRRLPFRRDAMPFVLTLAIAEILGTASFAIGARDGIAVASVMASQFGAISALISVVFFGERLRAWQYGGIALIATGVAVLSALRA